jgi:hypothetical protein
MPSAVAFAAIVAMPRLDEVRRAQTAIASPRVAEARANGVPAPAISGIPGFPVQGRSNGSRSSCAGVTIWAAGVFVTHS